MDGQLSDRYAGARRRTRWWASALLVAALAGGTAIAVAATKDHPALKDPAGATPPTPVPIRKPATTESLRTFAAAPDGSVLTIWQRCRARDTHCRYRWLLSNGSRVREGAISFAEPWAARAGDRFVVTAVDGSGFLLTTGGHGQPITWGRPDFAPTGFVGAHQGLAAVDDRGRIAYPPAPPGAMLQNAAVADDGSVVGLAASGRRTCLVALSPGSGWRWTTGGTLPGSLAGGLALSGTHAAAISSSDGATILPVEGMAVSTDTGRDWTRIPKAALPFRSLDSMAAAGDTLFVADAEGRLYRSAAADWTRFTRLPTGRVTGLTSAGDHVVGRVTIVGRRTPISVEFTDRLVAFDGSGSRRDLPDPRAPQSSDADRIVREGRLVGIAGQGRSVLTVWEVCHDRDSQDCDSAWQLRGPTGTRAGRVHGSLPTPRVAGSGYVISSWDRPGILIDAQGRARPLKRTRHASPNVEALIETGAGLFGVDSLSATTGPLPGAPRGQHVAAGTVTADGTVVANLDGSGQVATHVWTGTLDGSRWRTTMLTEGNAPDAIVSGGNHVAALASYDGIDTWALGTLAVSSDAGRHWTQLHKRDVPFEDLDNLAATSNGVLFASTVRGQVFRSTDGSWTSYEALPRLKRYVVIGAIGDRILMRAPDRTYRAIDGRGHATAFPLRGRLAIDSRTHRRTKVGFGPSR